jgi:hypothetical protein
MLLLQQLLHPRPPPPRTYAGAGAGAAGCEVRMME